MTWAMPVSIPSVVVICAVLFFVCFNCLGILDMSILYLIKSIPTLFPINSFPISITAFPSPSQVLCDLNPLILLSSASIYMCVGPFTKAWAVSQELYP